MAGEGGINMPATIDGFEPSNDRALTGKTRGRQPSEKVTSGCRSASRGIRDARGLAPESRPTVHVTVGYWRGGIECTLDASKSGVTLKLSASHESSEPLEGLLEWLREGMSRRHIAAGSAPVAKISGASLFGGTGEDE
jgi:hypothetical protein